MNREVSYYEDRIAALYIAFFNRAPDENGMNYWLDNIYFDHKMQLIDIVHSFMEHPVFKSIYSNLNDREFVTSIYENMLGNTPDNKGLNYYVNKLEDPNYDRADFTLELISGVLDFQFNSNSTQGLTQEEINNAHIRQDMLNNKIYVAENFITELGEKTNITNFNDIEHDNAYILSQKIISGVTQDYNTVNEKISLINSLKDSKDYYSHTNYGLGNVASFNAQGVKELDSTYHWDKDTITYSFNEVVPDNYYNEEAHGHTLGYNFNPLTNNQREVVRDIFNEIEKFTNLHFIESNYGDIKFSNIDMDEAAGFAYYPGDYDLAGDVFLNNDFNNPNINADYSLKEGGYGRHVIAHELGHALGLKHPFDSEDKVPYTLDTNFDNYNFTIMSYTNKNNLLLKFTISNDNSISYEQQSLEPISYSLFDVNALQSIYGINENYRSGNDTYSFSFDNPQKVVIWDTGGIDSFDLTSNKGDTFLELRSGSVNSIDVYSKDMIIQKTQNDLASEDNDYYQFKDFYDNWIKEEINKVDYNQLYTGKNNIAIAKGVVIENAYTGSGDDIVYDNEVDNIIQTNDGNDTIYVGNGGYDKIDGGNGIDTLFINANDTSASYDSSNNNHTIYINEGDKHLKIDIENIEYIGFNDTSLIDIHNIFS